MLLIDGFSRIKYREVITDQRALTTCASESSSDRDLFLTSYHLPTFTYSWVSPIDWNNDMVNPSEILARIKLFGEPVSQSLSCSGLLLQHRPDVCIRNTQKELLFNGRYKMQIFVDNGKAKHGSLRSTRTNATEISWLEALEMCVFLCRPQCCAIDTIMNAVDANAGT